MSDMVTSNMGNAVAAEQAATMYNRAKKLASGTLQLEIKWSTVGLILLMGFLYMIISSIGMSIFAKCEAMKGKPVQENLNKYLAATLIMGLVGSAAALNWTAKCENAKQSEKTYAGMNVALFSMTLLASAWMLRPKKGVLKLD